MFAGNSLADSISTEELEELKEIFKEEINSNRVLEKISSVEELVSVLEDRDALTEDVLLKSDQNFRDFVEYRMKNLQRSKGLIIPENVVTLLRQNFETDWNEFGAYLLKKGQLSGCTNLESVLSCFLSNCEGVSEREMLFRLGRSLEKFKKDDLRTRVVALMTGRIS